MHTHLRWLTFSLFLLAAAAPAGAQGRDVLARPHAH